MPFGSLNLPFRRVSNSLREVLVRTCFYILPPFQWGFRTQETACLFSLNPGRLSIRSQSRVDGSKFVAWCTGNKLLLNTLVGKTGAKRTLKTHLGCCQIKSGPTSPRSLLNPWTVRRKDRKDSYLRRRRKWGCDSQERTIPEGWSGLAAACPTAWHQC